MALGEAEGEALREEGEHTEDRSVKTCSVIARTCFCSLLLHDKELGMHWMERTCLAGDTVALRDNESGIRTRTRDEQDQVERWKHKTLEHEEGKVEGVEMESYAVGSVNGPITPQLPA